MQLRLPQLSPQSVVSPLSAVSLQSAVIFFNQSPMPPATQTYASHRRYIPGYHFFALPVVIVNAVVQLVQAFRFPSLWMFWNAVVWFALAAAVWYARSMAIAAQNRTIRVEERERLSRLMPPELRGRINELSIKQLTALRFASDDEVGDLAARCLDGTLTTREHVKKEIRQWRPDYDRV
jgi:hypothetical protein